MRLQDGDEAPAEEREVQHDQGDQHARIEHAAQPARWARADDEHDERNDEHDRGGQHRGERPLAIEGLAEPREEERQERGGGGARVARPRGARSAHGVSGELEGGIGQYSGAAASSPDGRLAAEVALAQSPVMR